MRKLESKMVPRFSPKNMMQTAKELARSLLSRVGWFERKVAFVSTCAIKACEYGKLAILGYYDYSGAK